MMLCDGTTVPLNPENYPVLDLYLKDPRAQVREMVDQINRRAFYASLFVGKQGLRFLDLGANLGLVSLYASPACDRVVAVEAEPRTFSMLRLLCELRPANNIQCIHAAVWPTSGCVGLSVDEGDYSCHTLINRKPNSKTVPVPALSWADLLERAPLTEPLDVVKVDIEGAEMEIFKTELLAGSGVRTWYFECHKTPFQTRDQSMLEMMARLKTAGYSVTRPRDNALIGAHD